jgi:uncharacterized protein (TIGR04255 family)
VSNDLPTYDNPPVVETVIGVQFDPVPKLTAAHMGWFWRESLGDEWPNVIETSRIDDAFERFGAEMQWGQLKKVVLSEEHPSQRLQFVSQDDERMIQLQNTRFHCNWRKRGGHYPSYAASIEVFDKAWSSFASFCEKIDVGAIIPNQWEVTYVNHIPQGDAWHTVADLNRVFPGLIFPGVTLDNLTSEDIDASWRLVLAENLGRLHIKLRHVRLGRPDGPEAIALSLTARGPIRPDGRSTLREGLDVGHAAIVRTFTEMTSNHAHKAWQRRQ